MIMGGRSRINKGSKNFKSFINNSKTSEKIYKQFNSFSFYKKIDNILNESLNIMHGLVFTSHINSKRKYLH